MVIRQKNNRICTSETCIFKVEGSLGDLINCIFMKKTKKMIWRIMNKISGTDQCVTYTCVEISHQILLIYKTPK